MTDQNEENTEKKEMRVMWIMSGVIVLIYRWIDGHEHADEPQLDARRVTLRRPAFANKTMSMGCCHSLAW
jgi:hypothetical protein